MINEWEKKDDRILESIHSICLPSRMTPVQGNKSYSIAIRFITALDNKSIANGFMQVCNLNDQGNSVCFLKTSKGLRK